jgi:hypothetical protein
MSYISIKDSCWIFGKSPSTLNRLVRKLKDDNIVEFQGERVMRYITLPNKVKKLLLLQSYLESIYHSGSDSGSDKRDINGSDRVEGNKGYDKVLEILDRELKEKNDTIRRLTDMLEKQNERIQVINTMLQLKGKEKISTMVSDIRVDDTESEYSSYVEAEDIILDSDTDRVAVDDTPTDEIVEDKLRMSKELEKRKSFLQHLANVKQSKQTDKGVKESL